MSRIMRHGFFPSEFPGYQPVQDDEVRGTFEKAWNVAIDSELGFRIPNMFDAAISGEFGECISARIWLSRIQTLTRRSRP